MESLEILLRGRWPTAEELALNHDCVGTLPGDLQGVSLHYFYLHI